jgi:hypothetical protein
LTRVTKQVYVHHAVIFSGHLSFPFDLTLIAVTAAFATFLAAFFGWGIITEFNFRRFFLDNISVSRRFCECSAQCCKAYQHCFFRSDGSASLERACIQPMLKGERLETECTYGNNGQLDVYKTPTTYQITFCSVSLVA